MSISLISGAIRMPKLIFDRLSYHAFAIIGLLLVASASAAQQTDEAWTGVLEEIIVTATRVATNLQETPMSVHAMSGEALAIAGIDNGRDLGIAVPNVVLNPGDIGYRETTMVIRGLPGVTTYFDGIWGANWGFLQRSFVELDRIEVLRGPQGTHFGRNTNGGAVQMITRPPAETFGLRTSVDVGEFGRRTARLVIDAPISERLLTKWTLASDQNDGFLDSQTAPLSLGRNDDSLLRADIFWQATDDLSLRLTANEENRRGSDPRIVRISQPDNPNYIALNVLAGNPDFLAQARNIDPTFPDPPVSLAGDRFTPETHESGFPGGTLGKWQTRSNIGGDTTISDVRFATLTLDWRIGQHWSMRSLTAFTDPEFQAIWDRDASEFRQYTGLGIDDPKLTTQELHFTGSHFGGRARSLLGFWSSRSEIWSRVHRWVDWDFAIPSQGPLPPQTDPVAVGYVRDWGATVGNALIASYAPLASDFSADFVAHTKSRDRAIFGELTVELRQQVELMLGLRITDDNKGNGFGYLPADAFRSAIPGTLPNGDLRAVASVLGGGSFDDLGTLTSPRLSIAYRPSDDTYLYASYAEGFTQGRVEYSPFVPDPIILDPEVVETAELGLRSDWLEGRLRFNATYFDSTWDGLFVWKRLDDPNNPGQPSPFLNVPSSDGLGESSGFELELYYLPGQRWELDFAIGLLDTKYVDIGDPRADGIGLQPGTPFAYAPDASYTVGARYRLPLAHGAEILFAGNYGWMDEYMRSSGNELQTKNADGSIRFEPSYGLLNARIVYRHASGRWQVAVFGTNLTDEWYVNGGQDEGLNLGYDYATIGRPRELGLGFTYSLN
jgi:iron complex outermembrane receptor protein